MNKITEIYIKECILDNQKRIRKVENIKALLEKKYFGVKQSVSEILDNIKYEFFRDLDDILKVKFDSLKELEKKVEQCSSLLLQVNKNLPESKDKASKIMKNVPQNMRLLSYLCLDFVSEDISRAKYSLGYIQSFPVKPEDLILVVNKEEEFVIGTSLLVYAKGDKPWHPGMISSLSGYAEDANNVRTLPDIVDNKDGSYNFLFRLNDYSNYTIQITLYGRNIRNSPTMIEIEQDELKKDTTSTPLISSSQKLNMVDVSPIEEELYGNNNKKQDLTRKDYYADKENGFPSSKMDYNDRKYNNRYQKNKDIDDCDEDFSEWKNSKNRERNRLSDDETKSDEKSASVKAHLTATIAEHSGVDLNFPIGVAVNHNDDIIICDTGHHTVWILDGSGKPKTTFGQTKKGTNLVRPSAVATVGNGNFVIKDNNGLHLYNYNGIYIRSIGGKVLYRPYGLAVTDDEKLITLNETWKPSLYVFNTDGQVEISNVFEPLIQRPQNSKCRFMASFANEVVVSDLGLSKMYKTTIDGKALKTFGYYGRTAGAMIEPSGITLDPKGTMLIGDSKNDRIQIFDWEGTYLGMVIFSHPIHRPSDITLTKDGRLFVLNYLDHYLSVYRLTIEE